MLTFKKTYDIIHHVLRNTRQHKNTCGCSSMVEHQPSKLDTWVRFPSPAFIKIMHEWLSGGVSPCQGEGRGFESRLVLFSLQKTSKISRFFLRLMCFIFRRKINTTKKHRTFTCYTTHIKITYIHFS